MKEYLRFIEHLAKESSKEIKKHFRNTINIESKSDSSPVTLADRNAEQIIRELIKKEYPEHGIIGEEFGKENTSAEYTWVLDPIDGTKSFITGALSFGTLIALLNNGKPIIGAINHPILDELLIGNGEICLLNANRVTVKNTYQLNEATLLATDHNDMEDKKGEKFRQLTRKVRLYRNWGDCYGYYLLATGYADIMIDPKMHDWDKMALIPIVNGAGGIITDIEGNDPLLGDSIIACCNYEIHKSVLNELNSIS